MSTLSFTITYENTPAGFIDQILAGGTTEQRLWIKTAGFYTAADGDEQVTVLEGIANRYLDSELSKRNLSVSIITTCLIIAGKTEATIHINPQTIARVRVRRPMKQGELIYERDIADIAELRVKDVEVPPDKGVIFITRPRWRTGVYFDLAPLQKGGTPRSQDLGIKFAEVHTLTSYHDLFHMPAEAQARMFSEGWFPFNAIVPSPYKDLQRDYRLGFDATANEQKVLALLTRSTLSEWLDQWAKLDAFKADRPFLDRAVERYLSADYISTISILMSKPEAVLRRLFLSESKPIPRRDQFKHLVEHLGGRVSRNRPFTSFLFPALLSEYLRETYFRGFDEATKDIPFSRHTVGHGVCGEEHFNQRSASQVLLLLHHLSACLVE